MGGKKRGGCFYNWIRSDLPDIEDSSTSVVLLAVRKSSPEQRPFPEEQSPVTSERHRRLLSQINERFRKTLSLDSQRSVSVQSQTRPKSMVQTPLVAQNNIKTNKDKDEELIKEKSPKKKRFRPKSFFSLETFLDSRRSEASSADDYSSSKYCKFYLESADSSPVFKGRATPDLLDTPGISSGESRCKKRLDKLENHYNKIQKLKGAGLQLNERDYEPNGYEDNVYSEPFYTSQTTLVLGAKPDSIDTIDKLYDRIDHNRKECIGTVEEIANNSSDAILCEAQYINAEFGAQDRNDAAYVISVEENDVLMNERTKELVVKIMDKSVDSIGSCSLDVEADNTDFSDTTSGSLNILTPSSTGSHFRDFTSRLQERVGPVFNKQDLRPLVEEPIDQRKKPSYLHLACSVNGYSNITTYDSKLRQKLNKSREASPGRPGNTEDMLRDCTDDAMATRLNSSNSNNPNFFKSSFSESSISSQKMAKTNSTKQSVTTEMSTHTSRSFHLITNGSADIPASPSKSFIQQRVERLYGPGALAQGFFNQKRQKTKSQCEDEKVALNGGKVINHIKSPECLQLSRAHILKRSPNGTVSESTVTETYSNGENCDPALPVMRHLRPEFRAQLPMLSPKRSVPFRSADNDFNISSDLDSSHSDSRLSGFDVVDRSAHGIKVDRLIKSPLAIERTKPVPHVTIVPIEREIDMHKIVPSVNGTLILNAEFAKLDVGVKAEEIKIDPVKINGVNKTTDVKIEDLDDNCNRVSVVNGSGAVGGMLSAVEGAIGGDAAESQVLDGHYFLELKKGETERLIRLAETAEKDLEELQNRGDASEEVLGFLRAAGGKARLLATQKMQQFEGLCHKNLNRRLDEPFPTTCTDLQGFWDMVSLQLVHIQQLFSQLEEMRAQGWTEVPTEVQPAEPARSTGSKGAKPRKPVSFKPADPAKAAATAKKRDEQRKALMQARRNLTANKTDSAQEPPIEIYAPPMRKDSEKSTSS